MAKRLFNPRVAVLVIFHILLFIVSGVALACHAVQISLLNRYPNSSGRPAPPTDWWPGYIVYTLYYVAPGFSCLCALILIIYTFQRESIRGDRLLSVINAALTIAVLTYASLSAGNVPWVGPADTPWTGPHDHTTKGLATYCSDYRRLGDSMITFRRCWLQNGTWLGLVAMSALWMAFAMYVFIQTSSMIFRRGQFAPFTTTPSFAALDQHDAIAPLPPPAGAETQHYAPTLPLAINAADATAPHTRPTHYRSYDSYDDTVDYPSYHSYHDPPTAMYNPHHGRPMSGSFDYNNAASTANSMQHAAPLYGHYANYEEKTAASSTTLSERSASEPPHSHDGTKT